MGSSNFEPPRFRVAWATSLLLAAGVTLFLILVSPAVYYPQAGNLDEWAYIGYVGHYFESPDFRPDYYKISRLPWILVINLFYGLMPWPLAAVAVAWIYLIAVSVLAYAVLRRMTSDINAFALSVLFTFMPATGGSGGWAYHNMLAGPLFLLTLLSTSSIARSGRGVDGRRAFLAGLLYGLTVHANLVFVNLAPMVLVVGIWSLLEGRAWPVTKRRFAGLLALAVGGGVAATLGLSLVAALAGRAPDFWNPQFELATRFVADSSNQESWWKPLDIDWIMKSPYLLFPLSVFGIAVAWIAAVALQAGAPGGLIRTNRQRTLLVLQFVFTFGIWVLWQVLGQTALDWGYFTYPLNFSALIGLAAMGGMPGVERAYWGRRVAMVLIVIVSLAMPMGFLWLQATLGGAMWPLMLGAALGFAGLYVLRAHLQRRSSLLLLVPFFMACTIPEGRLCIYARSSEHGRLAAESTKLVFDLRAAIGSELARQGDNVFVWYDERDQLEIGDDSEIPEVQSPLANPAASFLCSAFSAMPRPPETEIEDLEGRGIGVNALRKSRGPLVLVTTDPATTDRMTASLEKIGLPYEEERREVVPTSGRDVFLIVLKFRANPEVEERWRLQEERRIEEKRARKKAARAAARAEEQKLNGPNE